MKRKQFLSIALILTMTMALVLPVAGQTAGFSDIRDVETAENVEVLRMLGVIDGVGEGKFDPEGILNRAQFCKMAVAVMGNQKLTEQYRTFTIFPDVRASHWASGYINLSVRGEEKIIHGFPDGTFRPEEAVTFGQTVTILMRILGYREDDVGNIWPDGYVNKAAAIGLTDGVELNADDTVSRAQAAKLFRNLLDVERKSGERYAAGLGTLKNDVILLEVRENGDAFADQDGTIYRMERNGTAPEGMTGRAGTVILNKDNRVLSFVPDPEIAARTVTVRKSERTGIVETGGEKYFINPETMVYSDGKGVSWAEYFFMIKPGTGLLLYENSEGEVEYIFGGSSRSEEAVLLEEDGSTRGLEQVTDEANYSIFKNGLPAAADDLRKNDVAVFDSLSNTVRVSDMILTGHFEKCLDSEKKIILQGCELEVLPMAYEDMKNLQRGDVISVRLTADNRIAAVAPDVLRSNVAGIATRITSDTAVVELLCGLTLSGKVYLQENEVGEYAGQLVTVSAYGKDAMLLNRVFYSAGNGELNLNTKRLGNAELADNVRVYDKVGDGPLVQVEPSDVPINKIPANKILHADKDYAGRVNIIVLDNVTGDAYHYGKFVVTKADASGDPSGNPGIAIENGVGTTEMAISHSGYEDGAFGGLAFRKNESGGNRVAAQAVMILLEDVPNTAWNGNTSVTWNGKTYYVAADVACYDLNENKWVTLTQARAAADTADLYVDGVGGKIRIITVGEQTEE